MNAIVSILLLFFSLSANYHYVDEEYWKQIKEQCELKQGDYLVVIVSKLTNCSSCISASISDVNCIIKKHNRNNLKVLALVECKRDLELNLFKERYGWKHKIMRIK